MISQRNKWIPPKNIPVSAAKELSSFSSVLQSVLFQRGVNTEEKATAFFSRDTSLQHDPELMLNIQKAGKLVKSAVDKKHRICIYGDYDADGVTGTALLVKLFRDLGAEVSYFIPHRTESGYGLNQAALDQILAAGTNLLITVDCGITAVDPIDYAKKKGVKVILTDHHLPGSVLPPADAILNPNLALDPYPNKHLAGVGVVYKLSQHLSSYFPNLVPEKFLPLVAIGTVADVVPLTGENRYLTAAGLKSLNTPLKLSQGLHSLLGAANLKPGRLSASDIAFQIGPRINAAGRIDDASSAVELLLIDSRSKAPNAGELALHLNSLNTHRKIETDKILQHPKITRICADSAIPDLIFVVDEEFHPGVVGIAAGKLSSQYHRPVIIGSVKEDKVTASCRSIEGFDITKALNNFSYLLDKFGGHSAAAGFSTDISNISSLNEALKDLVSTDPSLGDLSPTIQIEAEVELDVISDSLLAELELFEPTGHQNPQPILFLPGVKASKIRLLGSNQNHLRFTIQHQKNSLSAIGFGLGALKPLLTKPVDLLFHLEENIFRSRRSLQLRVLDIRPTQT